MVACSKQSLQQPQWTLEQSRSESIAYCEESLAPDCRGKQGLQQQTAADRSCDSAMALLLSVFAVRTYLRLN